MRAQETQNLSQQVLQAPDSLHRVFPGDCLYDGLIDLAERYPFPHSVLGTPSASTYVQNRTSGTFDGEGWYVLCNLGQVVAAAHLSVFGVGSGTGHTLWRIRHPLFANVDVVEGLETLFRRLSLLTVQLRPSSAKLVLHLGEHEVDSIKQSGKAGFVCEGTLFDYYRLGERCFIYGRTVVGNECDNDG